MRKSSFPAKVGKSALSAVLASAMMVPSLAFADETTQWPDSVSTPLTLTQTDSTGTQTGRYITAAASGTYGYVSLVLGLANPVWDSAGTATADTIRSSGFAGVAGSIANEEPDPYMANFYYNILAGNSTAADNTSATPNALAPVGKSRPSAADTGVAAGGVPASFYYRPDIVFGAGSGEASGLADWVTKINEGTIGEENYVAGDEDYNPYILDGNADGATGYNTQVYSTMGVTGLLYETAGLVETLEASDPTLITRYGNNSYQIAENLENYIKGLQYYTLEQIDNGMEKATYAVISSIDSEAQTATLAYYPATDVDNCKQTYINKGYSPEYIVNAVGTDLGVELGVIDESGNAITDSLAADGGQKGDPQGGGGTTSAVKTYTVSLADLAKADVLFVQKQTGQNSGSQVTEATVKAAFEAAGITTIPRGFYNTSTNIDSGNMGCDRMQWYNEYLTFMYPEIASTSSVLAYYYENFYHLNSGYIKDAMTMLASTMTLTEGDSIDTPATGWDYVINDVQSKIDEGMQYYIDNYDAINAEYPVLQVAWKASDNTICNRTVLNGLAAKGDAKAQLQAAVEKAKKVDTSKCTAASQKALSAAIADAEAVLALDNPTEAQCNDAKDALNDAIDGLELAKTPIYRLYNSSNGEHLYTFDTNEYAVLSATDEWTGEGVAWNSPTTGTPVYRLRNLSTGTHLFTNDQNEMNYWLTSGEWAADNDGKPMFYSADEGTTDVYRLYKAEGMLHLLTMDQNEINYLVNTQGDWVYDNNGLPYMHTL